MASELQFWSPSGYSSTRHSSDAPRKSSRKLDLIKCSQCRIDKKKCTPVNRKWPEKCTRCKDRDLTCSKGERKPRGNKYTGSSSLSNTIPSLVGTSCATAPDSERLRQLNMLFARQYILSRTVRKTRSTVEIMLQPFRNHGFSFELESLHTNYLYTTYEELSNTIACFCPTRAEISASSTLKSIEIHAYAQMDMDCPYCSEKPSQWLSLLKDDSEHDVTIFSMMLGKESRLLRYRRSDCLKDHCGVALGDFQAWLSLGISLREELRDHNLFVDEPPPYDLAFSELLPVGVIHYLFETYEPTSGIFPLETKLHQVIDLLQNHLHRGEVLQIMRWFYGEELFHIDTADTCGQTALHVVCRMDWIEGAHYLLSNGADQSLQTNYGSLPLHYAAVNGSSAMCKLLLEYDGNEYLDDEDSAGQTPYDYAILSGNKEVIDFLCSPSREVSPVDEVMVGSVLLE